jgi:hypothetical protein
MLELLLALAPADKEPVGLADTVLLPLTVVEPVPEPLLVPELLPVPLLLALEPRVPEEEELAVLEGDTEELGVEAPLPERLPLLLSVGEAELLLEAEAVVGAVRAAELLREELLLRVLQLLGLGLELRLGLKLGLGLGLRLGLGLGLRLELGLGLPVMQADALPVPVALKLTVLEAEGV